MQKKLSWMVCAATMAAAVLALPCAALADGMPGAKAAIAPVQAKSGARLGVHLASPAVWAAGATAQLTVEYSGAAPGAALTVNYRVEEGLGLESAAQATLTADAQGRARDIVTVRGLRDGRSYLNVFVAQGAGGAQVGRTISLGLTFGTAPLQKKARVPAGGGSYTTTPSGEALVIVPAGASK